MSKARIYARNLGANWIGYGAGLLVAFFMSPFVVHSLGDTRYGVWTLLMSLTGYLGLVDIGVRGGTGRYINYHLGRGEDEEVSNVVSTSLLFYTLISVVIFAASALLALFFGDIFPKIPPELGHEAQWVLLLLGLNVWIGFFSSTFTQLLTAAERFDLQMVCDVAVLALRTVATIWVLATGRGLVELALVTVATGLLGCLLVAAMARWKGSPAPVRWRNCSWASFRDVLSFGAWSFVGSASAQVGLYASSAIIGILIGAAEITYYSIGATLIGYAATFVGQLTAVMVPDILKAGGRGDTAELRWLMGKCIRATMFVAVPILVGFMTLGEEFINAWMGPGYTASAWVLIILTSAYFGTLANGPIAAVLIATGRVRLCAVMVMVQSLAALALSVGVTSLTHLGIYGVAIGTVLPLIIIQNVWLFISGCKVVGLSPLVAARSTVLRWAGASVVFAIPCVLVSHVIPHGGWMLFWLKVGIVSVVYLPIGLSVVFEPTERLTVLPGVSSRLDNAVMARPVKG